MRGRALRVAHHFHGRGWLVIAIALLVIGVALRVVAGLSWWPVGTTLEDGYEAYASNPFQNELHPAGYSGILGVIGMVTRQVAAPVILQHLTGIASALLLWAATRRITRSDWAGLLPAAVVLLDPDFIFLEHSIMSESWFVLAISAGLYASVRALDEPAPYWRWPLLAGVALSAAVTIRTAALPLIAVAALAMALYEPRSSPERGPSIRSVLGVVAGSLAILLPFATANAIFGRGFGVAASSGWYLYARAAQFANCDRFTPPDGTRVLCQAQPASRRPGTRFYLFSPTSPAQQYFGPFGEHDGQLRDWARQAILAQPGDYVSSFWDNLRGYWLPGLRPASSILPNDPWRIDNGLDPQLAFTNGFDTDLYRPPPNDEATGGQRALPLDLALAFAQGAYRQHLEDHFYDDFSVHTNRTGLRFLRDWQRVFRFNAAALWIATLMVVLGLLVGTRRSRIGVLLFGVGGLSLILAPALTANFWGRYTVPMAGPLTAAAAVAIVALWRSRRGAAES